MFNLRPEKKVIETVGVIDSSGNQMDRQTLFVLALFLHQ